MLTTKPIDTTNLKFRYSGAAEHYEYNRSTGERSKEQTKVGDTPVWKIRCVAVYAAAAEHGEITVTVPHPVPPTAEFDTEISFTEMTVKDWHMDGKPGQTWHAETFTPTAPTTKPSETRARKADTAS